MKKTLVALAALAATTAFAQSSLTISGQLDAGVGVFKNAAGVSQTFQGQGQWGASRLRFTGSEDIGGGTKANFLLEMQPNMANGSVSGNNQINSQLGTNPALPVSATNPVNPATANAGTSSGALFNRGAWLGLSNATFGELRIGRQNTPAIGVICTVDLHGCYSGFNGGGILFNGSNTTGRWISANVGRGLNNNAGLSLAAASVARSGAVVATGNNGTGADVTRSINAFTYLSPNFAGFTAQAQYALGGQPNSAAKQNGNGNNFGVQLAYANGPIYAGLAYQTANSDSLVAASGKMTTLGATYDFGVVKVGAAYQAETASPLAAAATSAAALTGGVSTALPATAWKSAKGFALTAVVPLGAAAPYIKLGSHQTDGLGAFGVVNGKDSKIVNIGSTYSLSKRTKFYADYAREGAGNSGVGTNTSVPTLFSLGIQHTF